MSQTYYIISKAEVVDSILAYREIGYVLNEADANTIRETNKIYTAMKWRRDNFQELENGTKNGDDFIAETGLTSFYVCGYMTTSINGTELKEITNLTNPEGI